MPAVRLSRYEFADVHEDACGRKFLDVPDPIPRRVRRDDRRTIAGEGDTVFAVAWRAFRATLDREQDVRPSGFYWVIAQVNGIVGLAGVITVEKGATLRVPSVENLLGEVLVAPAFYARNTVT